MERFGHYIKLRLNRLRAELKSRALDGLLVTLPVNRRYLSGFTPDDGQWGESSGALLITFSDALVLTDFRYELTARSQAEFFSVRIHEGGLATELAGLLPGMHIKRLAFEAEATLVAQLQVWEQKLEGIELVPTTGLAAKLLRIKDTAEIQALIASIRLMEGVLQEVLAQDLVGRREVEIAREIVRKIEDAGAEEAAFPPIVASGPNAAEPHAEPGGRVIKAGEPVIFDVGSRLRGYCSDISRTVVAGGLEAADGEFAKVYSTVRQAQRKALAEIRPGMTGTQADAIARQVIDQAGYKGRFGHSLGHGVGLATHEYPSLGPRSEQILEPGMVFTIEPGIYLPSWGGVRLEEMVLLTKEGCELLNRLDFFYDLP